MSPQPGAEASPIFGEVDAVAPAAVRVFELDDPQDLDLGLSARGTPYRSALIVARRAGRPVGSVVVPVDGPTLAARDIEAHVNGTLEDDGAVGQPLPVTGPLVSVVITTCANAAPLLRCLDSVLESPYAPLEIIVVENRPGPTSPTPHALAPYGDRVRYIEEAVPGLSRARNAGLAAARGEIVAFTDDDVVADPDWVPALVAGFSAAPDIAVVTGLILPLTLETEAQLLLEQFASFGKGFDPITHRLVDGRRENPLFPYTAGALGSGANTAVRADVLRAAGGFDAALGAGTRSMGGEDLDLLIRLVLDGHALRYEPRALIWHEHPETMKRLRAQVRSYGVGLAAMASKHLIGGRERSYFARQLPRAARYLLSPASRKNEQKGPDFPRDLVARERLGMMQGTMAYLLSVHESDRADAAVAAFRPVWTTEVELTDELVDLVAPARPGAAYRAARILVRHAREPLGFTVIELDDQGRVPVATLRARLTEQFGPLLDDPPSSAPGPHEVGQPSVTVVISTRDRADSLRAALTSLLAIEYPNFDVVVIDNAPKTDATQQVVGEIDDPRVRMVLEPAAGLSRARNRGVAESTGEIVAFTDDDVIVDPSWLTALVRGFTRSSRVGCVTGMVPAAELETPAQAYFDAKVGWSDSAAPRLFDLGEHRVDAPLYPYLAGTFGAGANFAVRRDVLTVVGRFDEALGAGSPAKGGEDIDYFLRTVLAGYTIAYEPAGIVWHVHRRELGALRGQMDGYGSGLSAFVFKHLLAPRTAADVLRRVPSGFVRMLELRERGAGDAGDPLRLWAPELAGFVRGPWRYVRGRRDGR